MASLVCSTFHEVSFAGGETSINEGVSRRGCARAVNCKRMVRGLTKVKEKGSAGFSSYSVPGNSVERPLPKTTSILLNDSVVLRKYLAHSSVPAPVAASKFTRRLPMK